jgi:hypothetical protein
LSSDSATYCGAQHMLGDRSSRRRAIIPSAPS